jgi:hypothetical protein
MLSSDDDDDEGEANSSTADVAAMRAVLGEGPNEDALRHHLVVASGDVQAAVASYFGD